LLGAAWEPEAGDALSPTLAALSLADFGAAKDSVSTWTLFVATV